MSDSLSTNSAGVAPAGTPHARYLTEIETYEKWAKDWEKRGARIVARYRDERTASTINSQNNGAERFNILWSNVQTLMPALYARRPSVVVERRFKDSDPVARAASEILERATTYQIDTNCFDEAVRAARDDRLLPGRGQAWIRYDADVQGAPEAVEQFEQVTDDAAETSEAEGEEAAAPTLKYECVETDYIAWRDFGHNPARTWEEVYLVWRRVQMTREDLEEKFPEYGAKVPLDARPNIGSEESDANKMRSQMYSRAWVYELWDKRTRKVSWLSRVFPEMLREVDDPLGLKKFFPCPKPLFATLTTDTLIPVPDFTLYQDQANELDDINARLAKLVEACRVAGVYDASQDASLARVMQATENRLIPVNNWAAMSEKGGLKGVLDFVPLDQIVRAIEQLTARAEMVKQQIYEVTGISDIIRGATQASETATAQQIKGQYAALRLKDLQGEVARFARDIIAMTAEIIAEHFSPETVMKMTGVKFPTEADLQMQAQQMSAQGQQPPPELMQQPTVEKVFALLRDDLMRGFRIDIETDSTVAMDDQAQKEAATEFLTAMGSYIKEALPALQLAPELAPLVSKSMVWLSRQYRAGRELEGAVEQSFQALQQRAQSQAGQGPPPDPVAQAKAQAEQARTQVQQQRIQMDAQKMQNEAQMASAQAAHEQQMEAAKLEIEKTKLAIDAQFRERELALAEKQAELSERETEGKMGLEGARFEREGKASEAETMNTDALASNIAAMGEVIARVQDIVSKPRRVLRDETGRIAGVE